MRNLHCLFCGINIPNSSLECPCCNETLGLIGGEIDEGEAVVHSIVEETELEFEQ